MRALAGLIVSGPVPAILVMVISTLLGLLAPPLTSLIIYIGGAALALSTLYAGDRAGLVALAGAAGLLAGISMLAVRHFLPGVAMLVFWFPVWLSAVVLRNTRSLPWSVLAVCAWVALMVVAAFLWLGDPAAWWVDQLQALVKVVSSRPELGVDLDQLEQLAEQVSRVMTGFLAAGLVFACLISLLLGRWWQSLLVHPGGLRDEFYAFRLDKTVSLIGLLLVALASIKLGGLSDLSLQLALVMMVPFLLAGLAVMHAVFAAWSVHRGWLIAVYVLMSVLPQVLMMAVLVGALDPWLDFRGRAQKR